MKPELLEPTLRIQRDKVPAVDAASGTTKPAEPVPEPRVDGELEATVVMKRKVKLAPAQSPGMGAPQPPWTPELLEPTVVMGRGRGRSTPDELVHEPDTPHPGEEIPFAPPLPEGMPPKPEATGNITQDRLLMLAHGRLEKRLAKVADDEVQVAVAIDQYQRVVAGILEMGYALDSTRSQI